MKPDYIYNEFALYFGWVAKDVVEWNSDYDKQELTGVLSDGRTFLYDNVYKCISVEDPRVPRRRLDVDEWALAFGRMLRRVILLRCMRQEDLADRLGISLRTINRYATGTSVPLIPTIYRIADALNVDFEYLLDVYRFRKGDHEE